MNFRNRSLPLRFGVLFGGLILYAFGIVMTVRANIGYSPWDIFHQGIANRVGLTLGNMSIIVGLGILVVNWLLKEKVGVATVLNVLFIGTFMDLIINSNLIPENTGLGSGTLMMLGGLFVIGFATPIYLSAGLGAGPRDGLMLALTKLTKKDIALVRNAIELIVTILGYLLGGPVGLGTVITFLTMGYFVKFAFAVLKFDPKNVSHQYVDGLFVKKKTNEDKKTI